MSIEQDLLRYKKQIKQFEEEAQKQSGVLESLYSDLRIELELEEKTKNDTIIKQAENEIEKLKNKLEKEQKSLDILIEEIEEKVKDWD